MTNFINYLKDTVAELEHVSWPTNKQTAVYTALVIIISILVGVYIGLFDFAFSRGLDWFLK